MSDSIKSLINGLAEQVNKNLAEHQSRQDDIEAELKNFKGEINAAKEKDEELKRYDSKLNDLESKIEELRIKANTTVPHAGEDSEKKDFNLAKYMRGIRFKDWTDAENEKKAVKLVMADGRPYEGKALIDETGSSGGGYLIPDTYASELIGLLKAKSVFGSLPVMRITPSYGDVLIPVMSTGSTAYWVASGDPITASNPTFTQKSLTPWKCAALVPVSNDLILRSDPAAAQIVQQDCVEALALKADLAYIAGAGTTEPTGILNTSSINSVSMGVGSVTTNGGTFLDSGQQDKILEMIEAVHEDNAMFEAFIMNTRSASDLRKMKDSNNNYLLTVQNNTGELPTLFGYPYYISNQIPNNLTVGGSSDCSYIIGGQFSKVMIALWQNITIAMDASAAWVASATTYSAFQRDETLVRVIMQTDILVRNAAAMCKLTGLRPNSQVTPAE